MGQTLACLPCGREPVARMFPSLEPLDHLWNWDSTAQLYNHTRLGGVLERADLSVEAWEALDSALKADHVVLVTVEQGSDYIVTDACHD